MNRHFSRNKQVFLKWTKIQISSSNANCQQLFQYCLNVVHIVLVDTLCSIWGSWEIFEFASRCVIPLMFLMIYSRNDRVRDKNMLQSRAGMYKLFPIKCVHLALNRWDFLEWTAVFVSFGTLGVDKNTNVFCNVWRADERWSMKLKTMCLRLCFVFNGYVLPLEKQSVNWTDYTNVFTVIRSSYYFWLIMC